MKKGTSLHEGAKAKEEKRKKVTCQGTRLSGAALPSHMRQWGRQPAPALRGRSPIEPGASPGRADLHMANSSFVT